MSRPARSLPRRWAWVGWGLLLAAGCSRSEAAVEMRDPPSGSTVAPTAPASAEPAVPSVEPLASGSPGTDRPPAVPETEPPRGDEKRVYAKTRNVWIRGAPDSSVQWIGYLWHGGSVRLRDEKPIAGNGCATWYAVEPRGYVCVDGSRATLDADDSEYVAVRKYSPNLETPWPHRYAESFGLERYPALPTLAEQKAREGDLEKRLLRVAAARRGEPFDDGFDGVDLSPGEDDPITFASLPPGLQIQRNFLKRRSTVAYTKSVEHEGRTFLLTADLTWAPKDRVKLYPKVEFQGVLLGNGVELPIAFFKGRDRPQQLRDASGAFAPNGKVFERLSWVKLTGKRETVDEVDYLETAEGVWVRADDAVVPSPSTKTPWGADVGRPDTTEHRPRGRQTWIETSVYGGWLVAFEGTRAVFTTLISPGKGGIPVEGKDPVKTASTPTGKFSITGKFATATMESPDQLIHSDVPWTQNFSGPHALHSAYWHNEWGELKSGGCINVSPIDGKWLYEFTEPAVPKDWHAVRWIPKDEASTVLVVRR